MFDRSFHQICLGKPLKYKKAKTVLQGVTEVVNESKCKPNKWWLDQGKELYNSVMQKWLEDNILLYSTHNEGKSVVAEVFVKILKVKSI